MVEQPLSPATRTGWASAFAGWERLSVVMTAAVALVSVCELRLLKLLEGDLLGVHASIAESVVNRHAYWRAFQSRLLGPHLVARVALLAGWTYDGAYAVVTQGLVVLANVICFILARRLTGSYRLAFLYLLAFVGLFLAVQDVKWLYVWDFIDLVVMLLFAYAIATGARTRVFVYLFLLELLNREAAEFIALWLVLSAIDWEALRIVRSGQAAAGAALLALGVWWTAFVRGRLFLGSIDPGVGLDAGHRGSGEQLQFLNNVHRILHPVRTDLAVGIGIFWLLGVVTFRCRTLGKNVFVPLALLIASMAGATLLFAVVNETRVYIALIPFIVVLDAVSRFSRTKSPPAVR